MNAEHAVTSLRHAVEIERREREIRDEAHCDVESLAPGDVVRFEKFGKVIGNLGRVLRVNAKTVTLEPAFKHSEPQKIAKDKIVETRKP